VRGAHVGYELQEQADPGRVRLLAFRAAQGLSGLRASGGSRRGGLP
jgi:hypothetical protein